MKIEKCTGVFRFGFNGMEKDDEWKGSGNSYDFGARMYDSRLGRWLAIDPLANKYPGLSSYNFVANSPLQYIDPDGKKNIIVGKPEDVFRIEDAIWELLDTDEGTRLLRVLADSDVEFKIILDVASPRNGINSDKDENGDYTGSYTIVLNGNEEPTEKMKDRYGDPVERSMDITLGHELRHGEQKLLKSQDETLLIGQRVRADPEDGGVSTSSDDISLNEIDAVFHENIIRNQKNVNMRFTYDGVLAYPYSLYGSMDTEPDLNGDYSWDLTRGDWSRSRYYFGTMPDLGEDWELDFEYSPITSDGNGLIYDSEGNISTTITTKKIELDE